MTPRALLLAALVLAAASPAAAAADPETARVLEAQGLMGRWAADCAAPPSDENGWETIAVDPADGEVRTREDHAGWESVYRVVSARAIDARDTAMDVIWETDDSPLSVVYRIEDGRQTTWSSARPDGEVLIRDGRYVSTGEPISWLNRCPAG